MNRSAPVLYEIRDEVASVTLNRPERMNAWNDAMGTAYLDALDRAEADPAAGAIVVTGAGRAFCVGADLEAGAERGDDWERDPRGSVHELSTSKFTIAAVNGSCAGLGFAHAVACDVRFAASGGLRRGDGHPRVRSGVPG